MTQPQTPQDPTATKAETAAETAAGTPAEDGLPQGGATPGAGPLDEDTDGETEALDDLEGVIATLNAEIETLRADVLRARADVENAKRMADKRIQDNAKYALSNFIKELLPVADNMRRALSAATPEARQDQTVNTLAVGVEMTEKDLLSALQKHGVSRFESEGQPFDPHRHQAMQEVEKTDVPAGTVIQVYQDGFMIADRLLRPAMVIVSKGGPKREAPANDDGQGGIDRTV
jgi:molecular chaperone GrpE